MKKVLQQDCRKKESLTRFVNPFLTLIDSIAPNTQGGTECQQTMKTAF